MLVYIGLGTNLGDREANLHRAIESLEKDLISVVRKSSIYETAPLDVIDQPPFLNMVLQCETDELPMQLMKKLLKIEKQMGRNRSATAARRGPRLIDIDMLLYRNSIIQTPQLTVPHPRMLERRFVLEPLLEIAPEIQDPRTKKPIAHALTAVLGQQIKKFD